MAEEDNKTAVKKEERTLAVALIAVVLVCATLVIVGFFFLEKDRKSTRLNSSHP